MFRTVYCHLHGEPTWNGRILHTHYATGQQAEALVEHGDIRCLGPRCDKPAGHTLQNPVDGVTAYYGRDSGFRMDSEAREYRSFMEAIATESTEEVRFHYVFIDGYWKVMYRTPEGWKMKALALALRRCRNEKRQGDKPCLSPPALPRQEARHLNHYLWRLCHETINYLRNRRVCKASA